MHSYIQLQTHLLIDDTHHVRISEIGLYHWDAIVNMSLSQATKPGPRWTPPEYFIEDNPTPDVKYDVYAFGMTIYEVRCPLAIHSNLSGIHLDLLCSHCSHP